MSNQFQAAESGDLDWFRRHESGPHAYRVLQISSEGRRLHEVVCEFGHLELLKYLFEESPQRTKVNIASSFQFPIRIAAMAGHFSIVKYLLEDCPQREHVDVTAGENCTLRWASRMNQLDVVQYLLEECPQKDKIDVTAAGGNSAVHLAAENNALDVLQYLIDVCPQKHRIDISAAEHHLFRWAVQTENFEVVKYCLENSSQRDRVDAFLTHPELSKLLPNIQNDVLTKYLCSSVELAGTLGTETWSLLRNLVVSWQTEDSSVLSMLSTLTTLPKTVLFQLIETDQDRLYDYLQQTQSESLSKEQYFGSLHL